MSGTNNFTKNVIGTLLTKIILVFLKIGIGVLTARLLGPIGRGLFYSSTQVSGLVNTTGTLSIGEGLIYHIGKGKIAPHQVLGTVFMMMVGFTSILLVALYLLEPLLTQYFLDELPEEITPLIFLLIPTTMIEYFSTSALRGLKVFSIVNKLTVVTRVNIFLLMFIALVFWSTDVYTAVLAYTIAITLNAVLYLIVLFYQSQLHFSVSWGELNNIIRYGAKAHIGTLLTEVEYRLDIFILLFFLNATAVGIYSIGVTMAQIIWYIGNSVNAVLFPYLASSNGKDSALFTAKILKYTLFSNTLVVLGLIIVGFPLVQVLYGPMFFEAYFIFLVLSPGLLSDSIARSLAAWFKGTNRALTLSKLSSVSLAVNILFCIILIPSWGVYGAAFSSVISYTVRAVMLTTVFCKISKTPLSQMFIFSEGELIKMKTSLIENIKKTFC
jgi:O-antigen/teichoic acid export membrane protein